MSRSDDFYVVHWATPSQLIEVVAAKKCMLLQEAVYYKDNKGVQWEGIHKGTFGRFIFLFRCNLYRLIPYIYVSWPEDD